jgi:hypothetical protein
MPRMIVICPTRGRVELFKQMVKSFVETKSECTSLEACLDGDDPKISDYITECAISNISFHISNRKSVTKHINDAYERNYQYNYYHITNDDVIYHTKLWDLTLMQKLEDEGGGISYGKDLLWENGELPTFPVISKNVVNALGWLQYPGLDRYFGDTVWGEIGRFSKSLYYIPDVIIEHKHHINGKRSMDNMDGDLNSDRMKYLNWIANESISDIKKVKEALNGGIPRN